eukprot:CAMPEP_0172542328 /NCGR_PEP_ID=MMETSP1067-20121228/12971_1 /TAXON_ID=265564 ORGANISM="Thalassiosira punctigera, Strain Tpunct2005C2" /NCGR_SAMPLE_ID=MMETSP1067 /ASSEMBLY_ACC=CAM_ASM_000444 /LENGTH=191 /DNA_ID=CAMNT_0013328553 /DNA_START=362 /DNA_END=937 /DNA_ORIENTATION=-
MVSMSEKIQPKRSAIDYSIVACLAFIFLLVIILVDAYEYATVPGAKHARKHIHNSVESMSAFVEQMTKKEKEEMRHEVEEAVEAVQKKHDEVEEIVEKVEKIEKEVQKQPAVEETAEEKARKEEKKEEVVEEMVEESLGLENWCGGCKWRDMGFTCDKRVNWMMDQYHVTEVAAKEANIQHCSNKKRGLRG